MKIFLLLLILTSCLNQNNPKSELLDICEMAQDESLKTITDLTERQFEFNKQIQPIMKTTEVSTIFQTIASSEPDQKRLLLDQGLKDFKVDKADCSDLLKLFP
jgi:hypothetical protein